MTIIRTSALAFCLGLVAVPANAQPAPAATSLAAGETLLMIEARGRAEAMPDTMTVRAGVTTAGDSAETVIDENNRLMERLIAALGSLGVQPEQIATVNLRVEPQFADRMRDTDRPRILGYRAQNTLEVTFSDLQRVQGIISAMFDAGANNVSGPDFAIEDEARLAQTSEAALRDAVAEAQAEAATLADALGMRVGRILRVSDAPMAGQRYQSETSSRIVVTGSRTAPTPVLPGPIEVSRNLYVEFALVAGD